MKIHKNNIITYLDEKDKEKVLFFAEMLIKQSKYDKLREEIQKRRKEINDNQVISHQDFWQDL